MVHVRQHQLNETYTIPDQTFNWSKCVIQLYCQARVQVPNPLSQQAPNPDPEVRPSLNKHFEEFSEAAQVEIYRSASLQLNIVL